MEKLRDRVARLLRGLMDNTPALNTQPKVAARAKISQSTVQRVLSRSQAPTVDLIDDIARAFDIQPSQYFLLDKEEIELLRRFARLNHVDKERIIAFIDVATQTASGRHQLNIVDELQAPPELRAALERAQGRVPTSETKRDNEHKKAPPLKQRRRKA